MWNFTSISYNILESNIGGRGREVEREGARKVHNHPQDGHMVIKAIYNLSHVLLAKLYEPFFVAYYLFLMFSHRGIVYLICMHACHSLQLHVFQNVYSHIFHLLFSYLAIAKIVAKYRKQNGLCCPDSIQVKGCNSPILYIAVSHKGTFKIFCVCVLFSPSK